METTLDIFLFPWINSCERRCLAINLAKFNEKKSLSDFLEIMNNLKIRLAWNVEM